MVNCFLCLVNLSNKCATFNIQRSHGTLSKTKYGDLIGKLLEDQKLVITISDENCICETCNTLVNAFDRHVYEQNVIKQILSRQVASTHLKSTGISLSIDAEAVATFDKHLDVYQCRQCISFRTNKIEFVAAHFKAHQCKVNEAKSIIKREVNDDDEEVPIEEILLNPACKYEDVRDDNEAATSSKELYMTVGENSDTSLEVADDYEGKKRRIDRNSSEPAGNYTTNTKLPRYLKDIIRITKTRNNEPSTCQIDNFFVIEVPKSETPDFHFTCKICLRKFLHPLKLASHLLTHKDIKYNCNHCVFTVS